MIITVFYEHIGGIWFKMKILLRYDYKILKKPKELKL